MCTVGAWSTSRLNIDNTGSERELRQIVGSDDHAARAASLLPLIASARLHRLDPDEYLREVFATLPHWPKDGFRALAPKYWCATAPRSIPASSPRSSPARRARRRPSGTAAGSR